MPLPVLMPHQEQARLWIASHPRTALYLPVGAGKTLSTLAGLMSDPVAMGLHTLAIAPLAVSRNTWRDEIERWGLPFTYRSFVDRPSKTDPTRFVKLKTAERRALIEEALNSPPAFWVVNQELVEWLVSAMPYIAPDGSYIWPENMPKNRDGKIVSHGLPLAWPFANLIVDEVQGYKSHSAKRFKALKTVAPATYRFIGLTGTPVPLEDSWPLMYLIDGGASLGTTITQFRKSFLVGKVSETSGRVILTPYGQPAQWEVDPNKVGELLAIVSSACAAFETGNLNLPPIMFRDWNVDMPASVQHRYDSMYADHVVESVPDVSTVTDPLAAKEIAVVSRVVAAKHTLVADMEDAGASYRAIDAVVSLSGIPKSAKHFADRWRTELQAIANTAGMSVSPETLLDTNSWASPATTDFVADVVAANAAVAQGKLRQIASGVLYSEVSDEAAPAGESRPYEVLFDDKLDVLESIVARADTPVLVAYWFASELKEIQKRLPQAVAFDSTPTMLADWNDGKIPVLLIHPLSAGHGLNLQRGGRHLVFYTLPWSIYAYEQTIGRLYRTGQARSVLVHRIVVRDTIDEDVISRLNAKGIAMEAIMDAAKK